MIFFAQSTEVSLFLLDDGLQDQLQALPTPPRVDIQPVDSLQ
jgi:hypothetical protein